MGNHKTRLIALLETFHEKQTQIWEQMDDEQRNRIGTVEEWAPKDHLAHATFWTERLMVQLKIAAGDVSLEELDAYKKTNEETFEDFKALSWSKIRNWCESIQDQLMTGLQTLSAEDLGDPVRFEWTNNRPLWWGVVFTAVYHNLQHACDILRLCGLSDQIITLQEPFASLMEAMEDTDEWRGTTKYNLACYYALDGNADAAITTLGQALDLNPSLIQWSKEDSDLDSLRELSNFQALYQGE